MARHFDPDMNAATSDDPAKDVRMTDQMDTQHRGDKKMVNQYEIGPQIGKGQHGEVLLCYDTKNGSHAVVSFCAMFPIA